MEHPMPDDLDFWDHLGRMIWSDYQAGREATGPVEVLGYARQPVNHEAEQRQRTLRRRLGMTNRAFRRVVRGVL